MRLEFPEWIEITDFSLEIKGIPDYEKEKLIKSIQSEITKSNHLIKFYMPGSFDKRGFTFKFKINNIQNKHEDVLVKFSGTAGIEGEVVVAKIKPEKTNEPSVIIFKIAKPSYTKDGVDVKMDVAPYIEANRTYLPMRYVAEAIGLKDEEIVWDPTSNKVILKRDDNKVEIMVGSTVLKKNGVEIKMDVPAKIVDGRIVLPLRYVTESMDIDVNWYEYNKTITLQ